MTGRPANPEPTRNVSKPMTRRTRIKICGVSTPDIAEAAADAGADAIGLVFAPRSPRLISVAEARDILSAVGPFIDPVGLFVEPAPTLREEAAALPLSMLQLHGEFTPADLDAVGPRRVLKPIAFQGPDAFSQAVETWRAVHQRDARLAALLVDTPDPSGVGGGTGKTFDWAALAEAIEAARPPMPIVLAGGLTPDNVADAVRVIRPWAVDVSSGVERRRGEKDPARIRAFCEVVRDADASA